nr:hypothetical protein [Tanacetum cinerariifolium]
MADVNVNAPAEQAPAMAPPTRTDDQILPRSRWVLVGKSNCYLDVEKSQSNPIYKIVVDILKHTNFFRDFTASSTIPSIYIQQALTTIINLCLMRKTSGFERPRALVLQILRGIVNRSHIDYAERMWEEFTQSIHSFVEDKKNLALHTQGKKKADPIVIPSIRFTKLIIHHLQSKYKFHPRPDSPLHLPEEYILGYLKFSAKGTKREVFGMPIPNELITTDIRGEQYCKEYLEKVAKHQRYLAGEEKSDPDSSAPKPVKATKKSKPSVPKAAPVIKPAATKASESTSSQQPKPKPAPAKTQEKKRKLVTETSDEPSPAKSSKLGKREPTFNDEEADMQRAVEESLKSVHDAHRGPLPSLIFKKPNSGKFQPLLERRTPAPTEPLEHAESPSIYVQLGLTDSDTKSDEERSLVVRIGAQDEGRARPNPGATDVSTQQNPEKIDEGFTATAYPNVQENLKLTVEEHLILKEPSSSTGTLSSLQHLAKDFSFGDQFFNDKPSKAENEKTTAKTEAESMVSVTIQQDTSAIPPMTTPRICELKQIMENLIQDNKYLEERLDSHGSRLYTLENLDIPQHVSKVVDEIVTDAVVWAIQASLQNRFRDLPEADMKEILYQRIWETNSYKAHEDHMILYEALRKSMNRDHTNEILTDLAKARRKKKKRHDSPKTPPGSPPHQPPPPPPAGPSGTLGSPGASRSSQLPLPPLPLSTSQSDQSKSTTALSYSKTATSAKYTA